MDEGGVQAVAEWVSSSPLRSIAGLIAANVSFIVAVLVYMGWAYDTAFLGFFHLNPTDLGFGVQIYLLASPSLFSPVLVLAAVVLIVILVAWSRAGSVARGASSAIHGIRARRKASDEESRLEEALKAGMGSRVAVPLGAFARALSRLRDKRIALGALGAGLSASGLVMALVAQSSDVNTYALLALLASGPLLLTRALRGSQMGVFPYTLAIVVTAACILWAGGLYATSRGTGEAQYIVTHLNSRAAVAVYSVQPLALSGPGVTVQHLPSGFLYHYRYEGLRLLYSNSGTYYLLPQGWTPHLDLTYVLATNDQTRFELY